MHIVLVTGSRSFASAPDGIAMDAKSWMFERLWSLCSEPVLVVSGEAVGPDQWSIDFVKSRAISSSIIGARCMYSHECYRCDGIVTKINPDQVDRWARGRCHPLDRNSKLVEAVLQKDARRKTVLALVDPGSSTGGTRDTVSKARSAGIEVVSWMPRSMA